MSCDVIDECSLIRNRLINRSEGALSLSSKFNSHSNSNSISNSKLISNYFGQQLQLFRLASPFVSGKGAGWFVIVACNHVNACPGCRGTGVVALPLTNILGTHIAHLAGTCPAPFNRYTYSSQQQGLFWPKQSSSTMGQVFDDAISWLWRSRQRSRENDKLASESVFKCI